jgi:hypothetical protein
LFFIPVLNKKQSTEKSGIPVSSSASKVLFVLLPFHSGRSVHGVTEQLKASFLTPQDSGCVADWHHKKGEINDGSSKVDD